MVNMERELNVVIYRTGGIGDVILSTVSLSYIYQFKRKITVYWISFNPILDFMKATHPKIIPVEIYRDRTYKENYEHIAEIVQKADVVLDLQSSLRSMILCKLVARKLSASYYTWNKGSLRRTIAVLKSRFRFRRITNRTLFLNTHPRYKLMLDCTKRALSVYSDDAIEATPLLNVPEITGNNRDFDKMDAKTLWIGVCAGALYEIKRAPEKLFVQVLNQINSVNHKPVGFVFLGDEYDRAPSDRIIDNLNRDYRTINFCGQSLAKTAVILNQCVVFLSNDTAMAHMAEALQKDLAMLFGPTAESAGYAPFRKSSRAFSSNLGCRPCTKGGETTCRYGDKKCFEGIVARDVSSYLTERVRALS